MLSRHSVYIDTNNQNKSLIGMKTLEFFLVQVLCTHVLTVSSWFGSKLKKKKTDERLCACTFMPNSCIISLHFGIYVDGDVGMSNQIDSKSDRF